MNQQTRRKPYTDNDPYHWKRLGFRCCVEPSVYDTDAWLFTVSEDARGVDGKCLAGGSMPTKIDAIRCANTDAVKLAKEWQR